MIECFGCDRALDACACASGPRTMSDCESIPCPWCGALIRDLWEFPDSARFECDACENPIDLEVDRSVTYVARRVARDENVARAVEGT